MSEVCLRMSLPLDSDGFLRRECPVCERHFKWYPSDGTSEAEASPDAAGEVEAYFCPYCHEPAPMGNWWTQEQVAHARQLAVAELVGPSLRDLQDTFGHINQPGGFLRVETELSIPGRPEALIEPDDMVRVDVPCHPEEPLKVDERWEGEIACLICGIRYPVELVHALPHDPEEA